MPGCGRGPLSSSSEPVYKHPMARDVTDTTPISSRDELVKWFEVGCKPASEFRLGTEHEKVPFYTADHSPVPYEGQPGRHNGIRAVLEGMQRETGWEPITDLAALIGLADPRGLGAISLEPGGQFELSGAPLDNVHETAAELALHLEQVKRVSAPLGISYLTLGMSPLWTFDQTPRMPKSRYKIMTAYMPTVGTRGLDMMYRTSTVQVNLDFASEADMVKKMRVSLALQPLATALFANSPFTNGKPNGRLSERSEIWRDTDNNRAGMLPFVFEDGMSFERYVDYALDVPMYFVKRGDTYHDVTGASFRDLLDGKLAQLPGERATMSDWANHLSTIFPEVRLKRYIEMRGADVGGPAHIAALSAFFVGLLYESTALDAAWDLVKGWSAAERQALRDAVPAQALRATVKGRSLQDVGRDVLKIARAGLKARKRLDASGQDEAKFLDLLDARIASGRVAAQDLLDLYEGPWKRDLSRVFTECTF